MHRVFRLLGTLERSAMYGLHRQQVRFEPVDDILEKGWPLLE